MADDFNNLSDMLGYGDANSSRASSFYASRRDDGMEDDEADCSGDVCINVDESNGDIQGTTTAPTPITPSRLPSRSLIPTPKRSSHRPPPRRHSPATPTTPTQSNPSAVADADQNDEANNENSPYVSLTFTPGNTKLDQKSLQALQRKFGRARSLSPGLKASDSSRNVSDNSTAPTQTRSDVEKPAVVIEVAPAIAIAPTSEPVRSASAPRPSLIPRKPAGEATTPKQKKKLAVSFKSPAIEPSPGAVAEETTSPNNQSIMPAVTPSDNTRKSKAGHTPGYIPKYRGNLLSQCQDDDDEDEEAPAYGNDGAEAEHDDMGGDDNVEDMSNLVESFAHDNPTSPPANPNLVPMSASARSDKVEAGSSVASPHLSPVLASSAVPAVHTMSAPAVPVPYDTPYVHSVSNRSGGSTCSSLRYSTSSDCDSEPRNIATPWAMNNQTQSAYPAFPQELIASTQAPPASASSLDSPSIDRVTSTARKALPHDRFNYGAMNTLEVRSSPPQLQLGAMTSARPESRPIEPLHQPFSLESVTSIGGPKLSRANRDSGAPANSLGLPQPADNPHVPSHAASMGSAGVSHSRLPERSNPITSPLDFSNKHDEELYRSLGIKDESASAKPSRPVDHRDQFPAHSVGAFANASQGPRARGLARPAPNSIGSPVARMPSSTGIGSEQVAVARRFRRDIIDTAPPTSHVVTEPVVSVAQTVSGAPKLHPAVVSAASIPTQQSVQVTVSNCIQLQAPQNVVVVPVVSRDPGAVSLSRPGLRKRSNDHVLGVGTVLTQAAKADAQPFLARSEPISAQPEAVALPTPAPVEVPDVTRICVEAIKELIDDSSIVIPTDVKRALETEDDLGLDAVMGNKAEVVNKSPLKVSLLKAMAPALGTTVASRVPCDPNANDSIDDEERHAMDDLQSSRENAFKTFYWNKHKNRTETYDETDKLNESGVSVTTLGIDDMIDLEQSQSESGNDALMCFTSRVLGNDKKAKNPPEDVKEIILHGKVGYTTSITLSFRNKRSTPHSIQAKAILHRFEGSSKSVSSRSVDNSGVFKVISDIDGAIPPMGQSSVVVEFAPAADGVYSGILKIRSQRKAFVMLLRGESMPDDACEGEVSVVQSSSAGSPAPASPTKMSRSPMRRSSSAPKVRSPMAYRGAPSEKQSDPSGYYAPSSEARSVDDSVVNTSFGGSDYQSNAISPKCALLKQWVKKQLQADKYGSSSRSRTRDVYQMSQTIRSHYPMQYSPNPLSVMPSSMQKSRVPESSTAQKKVSVTATPVTVSEKSVAASSSANNKVYFRRSVVDFGTVSVGKMSRMKVEICNSSDREIVVRLSDPNLPFIILHNEIAVPARSFVRIPVRFVPVTPSVFATEVYAQILNFKNEVISVQFCGRAM